MDTSTPLGGWLSLRGRLTAGLDRLLPTWALLCGIVASGGFDGDGAAWFRLAFLILLVEGGWGTLWHALTATDWAAALRSWRAWRAGEPLPALPYTLPGTPGDRAARYLGQLRRWWEEVLRPTCGPSLAAILVALPVTAVLSAYLGPEFLLLSLGALAVMQLGTAWVGGDGSVAPQWDALVGITWPWLAGHIGFAAPTLPSTALALAFALAWGGRAVTLAAQVLAAVLLVFLHAPLGAGGLLLLLAPQLAFRPWMAQGRTFHWYRRQVRPWLLLAMLVAALALAPG